MSECVCGNCPSMFKFSTSEDEEYLCQMTKKQLYDELGMCKEELGRMVVFNMINTGKCLTEDQKKFSEYNTRYWSQRQEIIEIEIERRKD